MLVDRREREARLWKLQWLLQLQNSQARHLKLKRVALKGLCLKMLCLKMLKVSVRSVTGDNCIGVITPDIQVGAVGINLKVLPTYLNIGRTYALMAPANFGSRWSLLFAKLSMNLPTVSLNSPRWC